MPIFQWQPNFPIHLQTLVYQYQPVQQVASLPTMHVIYSMVVGQSAQVGPSTPNPHVSVLPTLSSQDSIQQPDVSRISQPRAGLPLLQASTGPVYSQSSPNYPEAQPFYQIPWKPQKPFPQYQAYPGLVKNPTPMWVTSNIIHLLVCKSIFPR